MPRPGLQTSFASLRGRVMNSFISMPPERRKLVCDQTAAQIGLSAHAIEKDYWVSWTLRELFRLP